MRDAIDMAILSSQKTQMPYRSYDIKCILYKKYKVTKGVVHAWVGQIVTFLHTARAARDFYS